MQIYLYIFEYVCATTPSTYRFVLLHQVFAGRIGVGTFCAVTPSSCREGGLGSGHFVLLHQVVAVKADWGRDISCYYTK